MWRETIKRDIERRGMLRFGSRIGVAVSGGADSVFLLGALRELGLACAVLHVNHKLRGAESDFDEAFVRQIAGDLPVCAEALPVSAGNTEQQARDLRYTFFAKAIAEGVCDAVATGHTLDDQAETVLGRFLRGSATAGLSSVLPLTNTRIIRPLLSLRRQPIRDFLRAEGIPWQEDCTNTDTGYTRNRIRIDIMPQLTAVNPALPQVLSSMAEWARGEEAYWRLELNRIEPAAIDFDGSSALLRVTTLTGFPPAVARRLVRRAIERVKGSLRGIGFEHVEAILSMTATGEGSGRVQLPGIDAFRSFDWLRLTAPGHDNLLARDFDAEFTAPGTVELAARGLRVAVQPIQMELLSGARVYNNQMNALDGECCSGSLVLRNWRPGDSFTPVGRSVREKIKTLFQDHRIPLWERRTWPVIANGNSILWTRKFGPSAEAAAGPHSRFAFEVVESGESFRTFAASKETCRETNEVM